MFVCSWEQYFISVTSTKVITSLSTGIFILTELHKKQ